MTAAQRYESLIEGMRLSGNPDIEFFYLGGPMHHQEQFNYPALEKAADVLESNGYNIMSAARIFGPELREECLSASGNYEEINGDWDTFMLDTISVLCSHNCVGGIFLPMWVFSSGSQIEINLLHDLGKPAFEFQPMTGLLNTHTLTKIEDQRHQVWCSSPGAVEIAAPGPVYDTSKLF